MILLPAARSIYAAVDPVHLRSSFDVLFAVARDQLGLDAMRSAVVLNFNRYRTRCKLLFRDGRGYSILFRRIDRGSFRIPAPARDGDVRVAISQRELALLLEGVDARLLRGARRAARSAR